MLAIGFPPAVRRPPDASLSHAHGCHWRSRTGASPLKPQKTHTKRASPTLGLARLFVSEQETDSALRELLGAASAAETGVLALLGTGVASEQTQRAKRAAVLGVGLDQSLGDAMAQRSGLT